MKAFEDHWDFCGLSEHVNYHPDSEGSEYIRVSGINRKEERSIGWRSALGRVLEWGMYHYGNDFLSMDLCKEIRQELEE